MVGSRELKTRLGAYLRAVRSGSTITVTERGVPVARLSPLSGEEGIDGALAKMEAAGLLSRGTGGFTVGAKAIRVEGEPIDQTIARERDDRL